MPLLPLLIEKIPEKQHKPPIIEDMLIELPQRSSMWRNQCAKMLHGLANLLDSPRQAILKSERQTGT